MPAWPVPPTAAVWFGRRRRWATRRSRRGHAWLLPRRKGRDGNRLPAFDQWPQTPVCGPALPGGVSSQRTGGPGSGVSSTSPTGVVTLPLRRRAFPTCVPAPDCSCSTRCLSRISLPRRRSWRWLQRAAYQIPFPSRRRGSGHRLGRSRNVCNGKPTTYPVHYWLCVPQAASDGVKPQTRGAARP